MASKIHNGILILTLILFASCRTQKPAPRPAPPETVDFLYEKAGISTILVAGSSGASGLPFS